MSERMNQRRMKKCRDAKPGIVNEDDETMNEYNKATAPQVVHSKIKNHEKERKEPTEY